MISEHKEIIVKKTKDVAEVDRSGNLQSSQTIFKLSHSEELLLNSLNELGKAINIRINPPSEILHVSNLSPSACNQKLLFELFKDFGKIKNIQYFFLIIKKDIKLKFIFCSYKKIN